MLKDSEWTIQKQADYIVSQQLPSGAIPWYRGSIIDPWDHVECAIALDLSGRFKEAKMAYEWMRRSQNPDGSWYFSYHGDAPKDLTRDTNSSSYIATGMWFNYLVTRDRDFLSYMWPAIEKSIDFVLTLQLPSGEVLWGVDRNNNVWPGAILTACCSTWLSIKYAIRIATKLGLNKPLWTEAEKKLARAMKLHPELFDRFGEDKTGHAMTWYYPVLVGLIKGRQAEERIGRGWHDFVIEGWGCKCFADRESVCVAETFELILALIRMGAKEKAKVILDWLSQFQDDEGVFYREVYWPCREIRRSEVEPQTEERNTWTSAAAILALVAFNGIRTRFRPTAAR